MLASVIFNDDKFDWVEPEQDEDLAGRDTFSSSVSLQSMPVNSPEGSDDPDDPDEVEDLAGRGTFSSSVPLQSMPRNNPDDSDDSLPSPRLSRQNSTDLDTAEPTNYSHAQTRLKEVINLVGWGFATREREIITGFLLYVSVAQKNPAESLETKYEKFLKRFGNFACCEFFIAFFQVIQIRSFSEAIAGKL